MSRPATKLLPELFDLDEVEDMTGIQVRNLRYAVNHGQLSGIRIERRWWVSRQQIDNYIETISVPTVQKRRRSPSRTNAEKERVAA